MKKILLILLLCTIAVVPFLGTFDYNTKGEPREAIVSLTMVESDNWIIPRNSVGEIAYKPPLFHWAIAAVSSINGKVTEFTSRIPSAVAFILLTVITYIFLRRRSDERTALFTSVLVFTAYELHRMGFNCRVDMLLTLFIVAAMYGLYRWYERGMKGIPWVAVLMMSLGTLTKGPIGALLPCLVTGVFLLLRKVNFFKALLWMMALGLLSLIIPACWYFAAYQQAGDEFVQLMMEENVGRMTNTMTYKVHEAPWFMNFAYILMSMAPWTLLGLISLRWLHYSSPKGIKWATIRENTSSWLRRVHPLTLYALTAVVVITLFFCIPECKRSVYLMPIYPFLSFLTAKYLLRMSQRHSCPFGIYAGFLSVFGIIIALLFIALKFVALPSSMFHGKNAFDSQEMVSNLSGDNNIVSWMIILLTLIACGLWWRWRRQHRGGQPALQAIIVMTLLLYLCFDAVLKPSILNAKSQKHIAQQIEALVPQGQGQLYEYIEKGIQAKGDPIHYYELNFYMGDRIDNFHLRKPQSGYLLIGDKDAELRMAEFQNEGYQFKLLYTSGQEPVLKQTLQLYQFWKQ